MGSTTPPPAGGEGEGAESPPASPIFDAIQSEWFRRRTGETGPQDAVTDDAAPGSERLAEPQSGTSSWASPGDEAWRVAEETVRAPESAGVTAVGLPKRVPGSNYVPGSAGSAEPESAAPAPDPQAVAGRLASYHRGVRRGRHAGQAVADETPNGASPGQHSDRQETR